MTVDRRRELFPSLERGIHLLSHSLGPVPVTARQAMADFVDVWERSPSEDAWATHWWSLSQEVGDLMGGFLGAEPGAVHPTPNATVAMAVAASCFDFDGPRRRVVTSALDFPSMRYFWHEQRRLGAELVVVPSDDGIRVDVARLVDEIDDRTALVAVSHVSYASSFRLPVEPLVEGAHARGAAVLLDVYQSAGIMPLDMARWGVDFAVGGTIKWLCGGPSSGYLYVRPDLAASLRPRLTGWIAHEQPFLFAPPPQRYDHTARRFAQGTPHIPGLMACRPGLQVMSGWSIDVLASENRRRSTRMVEHCLERGWKLHCPPDVAQRGGTVVIDVDDPPRVVEALRERKVVVDGRPAAGIRLSAHVFNTDEEVSEALAILDDVLGS